MECGVVVADLYSANGKLQSAEYIWCKNGKELILSVFTFSNEIYSTRHIYIAYSGGMNVEVKRKVETDIIGTK